MVWFCDMSVRKIHALLSVEKANGQREEGWPFQGIKAETHIVDKTKKMKQKKYPPLSMTRQVLNKQREGVKNVYLFATGRIIQDWIIFSPNIVGGGKKA